MSGARATGALVLELLERRQGAAEFGNRRKRKMIQIFVTHQAKFSVFEPYFPAIQN
jgi:hypothetical protein